MKRGYSVIGEFIIQGESFEHILKAINILKSWNPTWKQKTFMINDSEVEVTTCLETAFPKVQVYLCDTQPGGGGYMTINMA